MLFAIDRMLEYCDKVYTMYNSASDNEILKYIENSRAGLPITPKSQTLKSPLGRQLYIDLTARYAMAQSNDATDADMTKVFGKKADTALALIKHADPDMQPKIKRACLAMYKYDLGSSLLSALNEPAKGLKEARNLFKLRLDGKHASFDVYDAMISYIERAARNLYAKPTFFETADKIRIGSMSLDTICNGLQSKKEKPKKQDVNTAAQTLTAAALFYYSCHANKELQPREKRFFRVPFGNAALGLFIADNDQSNAAAKLFSQNRFGKAFHAPEVQQGITLLSLKQVVLNDFQAINKPQTTSEYFTVDLEKPLSIYEAVKDKLTQTYYVQTVGIIE